MPVCVEAVPAGFKGLVPWVQLGNRFFHRMLWLRMRLYLEADDFKSAVRLARKQRKLNPGDNLGVRFVLPLLLLQQGDYVAAKRATKGLLGEEGLAAGTIRAFCEFAVGNRAAFRREVAESLISPPWLRVFLMNQRAPLPEGDDGFRGLQTNSTACPMDNWRVTSEHPSITLNETTRLVSASRHWCSSLTAWLAMLSSMPSMSTRNFASSAVAGRSDTKAQ